jgi:hypothetical protein
MCDKSGSYHLKCVKRNLPRKFPLFALDVPALLGLFNGLGL